MKRLFAAIAIIILIITGCTVSSTVLLKRLDSLEEMLGSCITACDNSDTELASRLAREISEKSENSRRLFGTFMNHNDTDGLFSVLPMLPVYYEDSLRRLYEGCAECLTELRSIRYAILPKRGAIL